MITRRLFLGGAAATIAASRALARQVILDEHLIEPVITPMPSPAEWEGREVWEIMAGGTGVGGRSRFAEISLGCGGKGPIFQTGINSYSMFRWVSAPGGEILIPKSKTLDIGVSDTEIVDTVQIIGKDIGPDGAVTFCEQHRWYPDGRPAAVTYCLMDLAPEPPEPEDQGWLAIMMRRFGGLG